MSGLVSGWQHSLPIAAAIAGFARSRRAAANAASARVRPFRPARRERRGLLMVLPLVWRRCAPGTNHIAAHGVWRLHARRCALRANRAGETRWHLVRRPAPSFPFPGQPQQGTHA